MKSEKSSDFIDLLSEYLEWWLIRYILIIFMGVCSGKQTGKENLITDMDSLPI